MFAKVGKTANSMSAIGKMVPGSPIFLSTEAGEVLTTESGAFILLDQSTSYNKVSKIESHFTKMATV